MKKYSICLLIAVLVVALAAAGYQGYRSLRRASRTEDAAESPGETAVEVSGENSVTETGEAQDYAESFPGTEETEGGTGGYQAILKGDELQVYEETTGQLIEALPTENLWISDSERDRLEEGISFEKDEELYQYLESLTS